MTKLLSFDVESSIDYRLVDGKRKEGLHGIKGNNPNIDAYTIIYGSRPDRINLKHSEKGFKHTLPVDIYDEMVSSDFIVGVNLKYDLLLFWQDRKFRSLFANNGCQVWDCSLVRYLLSAQRHKFPSLAELQTIYLGEKTKESRISYLFSKRIGADEIIAARHRCPRVWALYKKYSIEDGRTPLLIMKAQYKEAKEKGMLKIIKLYNEYLLSLVMMEYNGIPVDVPQAEITKKEFMLEMLTYVNKAEEIAKKYWVGEHLPMLNINSRHHASVLLFGGTVKGVRTVGKGEFIKSGPRKGAEKTRKEEVEIHIKGMALNPVYYSAETKAPGIYKTDDAIMIKIGKECKEEDAKQYCQHLKKASNYKKLVSTYIDAFIERSVNGCVSPTFNNTQVATGRLSCSKPNCQNVPSKDENAKNKVQGLLCAPEGWVCVAIDFSQLEIVVKGALSQDIKLIEDIENGIDFHVKRLAYAEGLPYEEVFYKCMVQELPEWKAKRKAAKTISFQKEYGASPAKLAASTGLSLEVIQQIFAKEDEEYSTIAEWEKNTVQASISKNVELSKKWMLSKNDLREGVNSKKWLGDVELLPIRGLDKKTYTYDRFEVRHVGYYQSPTGKRYGFEEQAVMTKRGDIFKYFSPTEIKNYGIQGTAGDIQAMTSVEMFSYLLENEDKVKLVNEVHDSKWFIIKKEHLDLTIRHLYNIITNVREIFKRRFGYDTNIDFRAEVEIGKNFAEMTKYNVGSTDEQRIEKGQEQTKPCAEHCIQSREQKSQE